MKSINKRTEETGETKNLEVSSFEISQRQKIKMNDSSLKFLAYYHPYHTKWLKYESISTKIWDKAKMSIPTIFIQYYSGR